MPNRAVRTFAAAALLAVPAIGFTSPAHASSQGTFIQCVTGFSTQTFTPPLTFEPKPTHLKEEGTVGTCVSDVPGLSYGTYEYNGNGTLSCLTGSAAGKSNWKWHKSDGTVIGTTVVGEEGALAVVLRPNGNNVVVITAKTAAGSIIHPGRMVHNEQLVATDQTACAQDGMKTQDGINLGLNFTRDLI
ncbi:hypothetical protein [Streptomyces candidus]|uniref:Secreted protein n=1 Tax=Streptomyces candidus TaxID=67283 RepID=A0A7X0HLJ9_9ACTN|nr:hypothetical protein [Streptomyces candidus]MBB6439698.1 hypothetical protein [Streptomyces candidus]GHH56662.1 hypothetical protein GCM10018773_62930 [Streptomyces candidus]